MRTTLIALVTAVLAVTTVPADAQVPVRLMDRVASNSGSIDAVSETVTLNVQGRAGVAIQLAGTFTGTLTFEVSVDNSNWQALTVFPTNSTTGTTTATSTGIWFGTTTTQYFRVRSSAWTSGTATVSLEAVESSSGSGGGGGGGSTQYAEDMVHNSGDTGTMALAVRQDSHVDLAADGDYIPLTVDADGNLRVTGGSGTAPTHVDDAAFTVTTDDISPNGLMFDDTTPDSVDEGDAGIPRMSANRNAYTTIRDAAGNERGVNVTAANELLVELGAGTASIGVLGANDGVDIGDVDVASAPNTVSSDQQDDDNNIAYALTIPVVSNLNYCDNGTNWERCVTADGGSGAITANTSRVTIAADDIVNDAQTELAAAIDTEVQVDVVAALPAGANNIGQTESLGANDIRPTYCNAWAELDMSTATTTEIIAGVGGDHIYICSYAIHVGGATDVTIVSGSGTNCATTPANVSPTWDFAAADAGINRVAGGGSIVTDTDAVADAICVTSSAAVDVDVEISYAQY